MGTQGPFKEYIFTGTSTSVYSTTNPPPPTSLLITDTTSHDGNWHSIYIVSASRFTALSGSLQGAAANIFPTNSTLTGNFVTIKLATGVVIANQ